MKKKNDALSVSDLLRLRAEMKVNQIQNKADMISGLPDELKLYHELQVYQIELEMQNEELLLAHSDMDESKKKISDFIDFAPNSYFTLNQKGFISDVNFTGASLLGINKGTLLNLQFAKFIFPADKIIFIKSQLNLLKTQQHQVCELRMSRSDEQRLFVRLDLSIIKNRNEFQILVIATDITIQKQIEDTQTFLLKNEWTSNGIDFFEALAEYLAKTLEVDYVCIDKLCNETYEAQTVAIYFDGQYEDNVKYQLEDTPCGSVVGQSICSFPREVRHLFPKDKILQDMQAESYVGITLWGSDGNPIGLIAVISRRPLKDTRSIEIVLKQVSIRAVSELEHRQIESELKEREFFFMESQRAANIGSYKSDFVNGFWEKSDVLDQIFGIDKSYSRSVQGWLELIHPDDRKMMNSYLLEDIALNRNPFDKEYRIIRKTDGETRWVHELGKVDFDKDGNLISMLGTIHDITERKNAEEVIKSTELKFRKYVDFAPHGIFVTNEKGEYVDVNSAACTITGFSKEELLTMKIADLVPEESLENVGNYFKRVIKDGHAVEGYRYIKKDRSKGFWSVDTVKLSDTLYLGFVVDTTLSRQAEEALAESEQRYRSLFEESNDAIFLVDLSTGKYLDCNRLAETLTGYAREEILGMRTGTLLPSTLKGEVEANLQIIMSGNVLRKETEIISKEGKMIPVEFNSSLISINKKQCILSLLHDISDRKAAEKALKQSEARVRIKLQSILSPERSIADLELEDILDIESVQKLMDSFNSLVDIPMAIVDMKGRVLVKAGWSDVCSNFHRIHPETCWNCIESDVHLSHGIPEGEFRLYKCKNHMWDIATPLIIGGEHKGNLFLGQFFLENEPIDYNYFDEQAVRYGFVLQEYLDALDKVPRIGIQKLDYAKEFFLNLSRSLSQLSYSNIKLAKAIAQQKQVEDALRESEEFLKKAQEIGQLGSWSLDLVTNRLTWSDEMYNIFGELPQEFTGTYEGFLETVHPLDRDAVNHAYTNSIREGKDSYEIEHRVIRKHTGELRHVIEKCEHIRNASGKIIRSVGMTHDITDRKLAEEALSENERLLRESQSVANIGSYSTDLISNTWKASPEIYKIFGIDATYPRTIEAWENVIHPDYREQVTAYLQQMTVEKKLFDREYKIIRVGDGKECWVHGLGKFIYNTHMNPVGIIGTIQDVTSRKQAEEALRESEATLNGILNATTESVWLFNTEGKALLGNKTAMDRLGLPIENITSKSAFGFLPSDLAQTRMRRLREVAKSRKSLIFEDKRNDIFFEHSFYPIVNHEGRIDRVAIFSKDITIRKQAEEKLKKLNEELENRVRERTSELTKINAALQATEEKYRTVADYTYDWEYWISPGGSIQYMSPSVERITGYVEEDFKQNPQLLDHIIYPEDQLLWGNHKFETLKSDHNVTHKELEFRIVTKSGEVRWIGHVCKRIYIDGKYLGIRVSNRDITEKVKAENELFNVTVKVEEHERNRISRELHDGLGPLLSTIKLYFQWLAETDNPSKIKIITEKGNQSINRAIQTTREVSHGLNSQMLITYGYVGAILQFIQSINDTRKLTIEFYPNSNERFSELLEVTLYRITTELINNTINYAEATHVEIKFDYHRDKKNITFTYTDNGIGFDMANIEKADKGIGLLNIKQRLKIVRGKLSFESGIGKGVTVHIELPVSEIPE